MVTIVPTDPNAPAEPTAVEIAASMLQGVLASGVAGPYGLPASVLVGGALQIAHMFNGQAGKVITMADLEQNAATTGANLDRFSGKVDALPS